MSEYPDTKELKCTNCGKAIGKKHGYDNENAFWVMEIEMTEGKQGLNNNSLCNSCAST